MTKIEAERIVVTGAGGFVGRWTVAALAERAPGASIECWVRRPPDRPIPGTATVVLDVCDAAAVTKAIRRFRPSAVLHLAAVSRIGDARAHPRETWSVNLYGTMNIAEAILAHVPHCRLVFAGSGECYGGSFARIGPILDESAPLAPANVYSVSKASADLMLGQLAYEGLIAARMRPFNHIGPGQSDQYAATAFAAQIARIEANLQPPVIKVGNLSAERDFLDVRDVAAAYAAAMLAPRAWQPGEIMNLCSGTPVSIRTVLDRLIAQASCAIAVETDESRLRAVDLPRSGGDSSRARDLLNWAPRWTLDETLATVLEDWRGRIAAGG